MAFKNRGAPLAFSYFTPRRLLHKLSWVTCANIWDKKEVSADQKQMRSFRKLLYITLAFVIFSSARRLIQRFCYKRQWLKHNIKVNIDIST